MMYEVLIAHLRECAKLDPSNNTFKEASDAIEKFSELADEIPHVCECCVGCELEKKNGGCDNAFIISQKRAMQYLITERAFAVCPVLCKGCKHYIKHDKRCIVWNHGVSEDDYCSRGQKKEVE